jgi:IS30 family transposase
MLGRGKPCVVTLVERKTGYLEIGKLNARTAQQLSHRTTQLIQRQPRPVRTITADNGRGGPRNSDSYVKWTRPSHGRTLSHGYPT